MISRVSYPCLQSRIHSISAYLYTVKKNALKCVGVKQVKLIPDTSESFDICMHDYFANYMRAGAFFHLFEAISKLSGSIPS